MKKKTKPAVTLEEIGRLYVEAHKTAQALDAAFAENHAANARLKEAAARHLETRKAE